MIASLIMFAANVYAVGKFLALHRSHFSADCVRYIFFVFVRSARVQ